MYDLKDLGKPYKEVGKLISETDDCPVGVAFAFIFGILALIFCILSWFQYRAFGLTDYQLDYNTYWEIVAWIAGSLVFYPITFTIIYTPIALLLAIPVVLYKHVFKLG